jgi:regulator of RNase E activity RraA
MTIDPAALGNLSGVSTATVTTVLLKKGLRNVWMRGTRPIRAGQPRLIGRAFTLRFVPAREDLATPESWSSPISTRAAIEAMPEGCITVVDAMGVTDGVVRDLAGVLGTGLPVWCRGAAAPASVAGLTFVAWQEPIGCGGVAVFPDDIIMVDDDGAVVIPQKLAAEVATAAAEQERMEEWIMAQVNEGAALPGLYPPNAENKARYETWAKGR